MAELQTGGFLGGMLLRKQSDREDQTLAVNQMNAATQQVTALHKQIEGLVKQANDTVAALDQSGIPRTDPRFKQALSPIASAALRLAGTAEQSKLPGTNGLTDMVSAQFKNLYLQPTPEQAAVTGARAQAAGLVAGAEATAKAAGVPTADVLQAKGVTTGAPTTRQVPLGDEILTQEFRPGQGWVNVAVGRKQPGVVVNTGEQISGAGSMAATKELGKGIGKRANDRITQAFDAQRQNFQLERVKAALSRGAQTGLGEETLLDLRSLAGTVFGIQNSEQMAEQELIRTVSNEMALRLRNPESGLGLTGNTSNKDLQFLKDSVIGLDRTELGNIKLIDLMQRFNQLKLDTAREQARIIAENDGVVPNDLDQRLMDFVDKYDFLTDQEVKDIRSLTQGVPKSGLIQNPDGSFTYIPKR